MLQGCVSKGIPERDCTIRCKSVQWYFHSIPHPPPQWKALLFGAHWEEPLLPGSLNQRTLNWFSKVKSLVWFVRSSELWTTTNCHFAGSCPFGVESFTALDLDSFVVKLMKMETALFGEACSFPPTVFSKWISPYSHKYVAQLPTWSYSQIHSAVVCNCLVIRQKTLNRE